MARTQQVKEKKGTPIQLNTKKTPLWRRRGFMFIFSAYEMRRDTSSRLRFPSVTYPKYVPIKKATRFLSGLHFPTAGWESLVGKLDCVCILNGGAILRRACVFFRSRTPSTLPSRKPRASCLACISGRQGGCVVLRSTRVFQHYKKRLTFY